MTTLKGTAGLNIPALKIESQRLGAEFEAQQAAFQALKRYEAEGVEPPKTGAKAPASKAQAVVQKEAASKSSPVDWSRFDRLRSATREQLERAIGQFRAIDRLDLDFQKLVSGLHYLGTGIDVEKLPDHDARMHYFDREESLKLISAIRRGLEAAGDCPATANFPSEQLTMLEGQLREDLALLLQVKGKGVATPPSMTQAPKGGGYGYGPVGDPSPEMLPPVKAVLAEHVRSLDDSGRILEERLQAPGLAKTLAAVAAPLPADRREELGRLLGAYAILADEAVHAPDYQKDPMGWGPDHRQAYRARKEPGFGNTSALRRQISRASLYAPLVELQGAKDPVRELEKALARELLREIGVPESAARGWGVKTDAVVAALEGEAFLPLRALNERAPYHIGKEHSGEMSTVVRELTRAVVEGRFEEWRASHPASEEQLAPLTPAQREVWLGTVSTRHQAPGKDGKAIELETLEPRGFEMFWATKVGGPSHGFDTMTQCCVPLLTNARNNTIVVKDPRWPNFAGRTYLRLVELAKTREPVLFLESSHRDFPYPGSKLETEKAIIKHAIEKAKAMNVRLVLSGRNDQTIQALGVPGEWRNEQYRLAPSLLNEAASVFGPHDWVQKAVEVRGASSTQYFVDLPAWEAKLAKA